MASDLNQAFAERASATEKMLNDEFSRLETSVNEAVTSEESKIKDAIRDHTDSVTALLAEHRQSIASAMKTEWPALLRPALEDVLHDNDGLWCALALSSVRRAGGYWRIREKR
ncbi:MbeB family mobilization protein (plasmid) [Klebsiella quasivariicola]